MIVALPIIAIPLIVACCVYLLWQLVTKDVAKDPYQADDRFIEEGYRWR